MKGMFTLRRVASAALVLGLVLCGAAFGPHLLSRPGYDQNDQLAMSRPDPKTIWRYRPDVNFSYTSPEFTMRVRTNDEGLRGGPPAGPDDAPTILFIGDAFTFGWGVAEEQRFSDLIGHGLGRPVRIVNAGHWMYSFDQQLVLMKELIARHRPRVVVQDFYWMYIRILYGHDYARSADGGLQAVRDAKIDVDSRGVVRFRSDKMDGAGDWLSYLRPGPQNADLWRTTEELVDETIRTVRDSGAQYVPFLTPASIELPGGNWANVGWPGKEPPQDVDVDLPAARLASLFSRRGVEVVGLAAAMRGDGAASGLYYPQDGHWTPQANALAARILTPYVAKALERGQ
jgi:hypothetical protein